MIETRNSTPYSDARPVPTFQRVEPKVSVWSVITARPARVWPVSAMARGVGVVAMLAVVSLSAIVMKELSRGTPPPTAMVLAEMGQGGGMSDDGGLLDPSNLTIDEPLPIEDPMFEAIEPETASIVGEVTPNAGDDWLPKGAILDTSVRFFNGRPMRPARTMTMVVTAYSPDERSCGDSADGITASLHHVTTNGHRLVAADRRVLALGSKISIPGYDGGEIVPVLDVGGAIKGNRLDVLFPTHEQARAWGVRRLKVVVWEYADGKPAENWRAIRDSRPAGQSRR
jgi:3D (Asp-Asp-Asp) domain-containing protein